MPPKKQSRLIIVDISSFIFRAFFAIRPLHSPEGIPVNAVHGVLSMMLKLLSDYRPTHIFMARDSKEKSFRHEMFDAYKANRSEPPEDLIPQFDLIGELQDKLGLPSLVAPGFEADDIIGSAAIQWKKDFDEVLIASGDKDLMQFIGDNVKMIDTMKNKMYGPDEVFEKMGVYPDQVVDYLSMIGDPSDNIPGMKGIGAKGAAKLLAEYKTLDKCIENKSNFKNKRVVNAFENHIEDAHLSKKLIKIVTDIDLQTTPDSLVYDFHPQEELYEFLKSLGFKTTIEKIKKLAQETDRAQVEEGEFTTDDNLPEVLHFDYELVKKETQVSDLIEEINSVPLISIYTRYTSEDPIDSKLIGMGVTTNGAKAYYLPFGHEKGDDLLGEPMKNLSEKQLKRIIEKVINREDLEIASIKPQRDITFFALRGGEPKAGFFDISLAAYVIDQSSKSLLDVLTRKFLDKEITPVDKTMDFLHFSQKRALEFSGERAGVSFLLTEKLKLKLEELNLEKVFYDIDSPCVAILSKMEREGIHLNISFFEELEEEFAIELSKIEKKIAKISGEEVNLKSPKQVGGLLFDKLELPVIKKTKTGYSTDVEVLEELSSRKLSEVPDLILKYRELDKLNSTYVKTFPKLVNSSSGKLHTHFNQNVAATGRLSSDKPNLQNIPVRTENGKRVRKGFIAAPGKLLFAADYSQVELRILAHLADDQVMIDAFNNDIDIHKQTASEVMDIPLEKVTSEERSKAKAVNFGLMYGQSSFGLAKALRISRKEAKEYITMYFERFNRVKHFLDGLKELCEEKGYSETLFGRKRFLPDIHSKNRTIKSMAERVAVNSPIQGTAADIIKKAMIAIDAELKDSKLDAKMLLQVHDELIFEVSEEDLKDLREIVVRQMEGVCDLKVPLKVDSGWGVNWYDLK